MTISTLQHRASVIAVSLLAAGAAFLFPCSTRSLGHARSALALPVLAGGELAPEEAVREGRSALDEGLVRSQYPWYDAKSDGVRSVAQPQSTSWKWLEDLLTAIIKWLQGLNFKFSLPFFGSVSFFQLLGVLALLGLVAGLVFLLNKLYRKQQARSGHRLAESVAEQRTDADRIEALPVPVERGPRDLLSQAEESYRRGEYGEAIKYLFSHQLVELDKNHLVRLAKGKTNRQYLRELRPREALIRLVEQTMVAFEDTFFGNHRLERARFESCWSELDRFRRLVQQVPT